ncbi:MAG TPA: HAMP domain-containing sensor histidine kinase [Acidimicrobiales bacterium]|nr:HAMP domain-containing sensor histidine kinase [Acidimicrobiales bacterium]
MSGGRAHRRHAVRVATMATLIVMAAYVIAALLLNLVVSHHLLATTDARLSDRLDDARQQTLTLPGSGGASESPDLDDAPVYLWSIAASGAVTPLTPASPPLPSRHWDTAPVTLPVGASTLRFDALHSGDTLLVAGQSLSSVSSVRSTLLVAELVFGVILAGAVFAGATIVGLRASAPSELVRRRQAEFTADASHELRTPISVIEAEVGLVLSRPREPGEYREVLERVGQESGRLRRIVEDLLWLARADNEPPQAGASEVADVAEIAEHCADRFAALAARRQVTLAVRRTGDGPFTVAAPTELIDRLAGVLLDNACKFAGEGGRVEVTSRLAGGRVSLRVDDSGPGIPADQRDAVFDRFHRASASASGTGLGLAIADSVVRATNGEWHIGVADLGGARMEVSWRRQAPRRTGRVGDQATLSESLP